MGTGAGLEILARLGTSLASAFDVESASRAIVDTTVPALADQCEIDLGEQIPDDVEVSADRARLVAPMRFHGRALGTLRFARTRPYRTHEIELARDVALQAGSALERARTIQTAHRAVTARDEALSLVTHDLQNYLSTITMMSDVLVLEHVDSKAALTIRCAARRMLHLLDDLRDHSLIEHGRFTLAIEPNCPISIASEAVELFRPQAVARKQAIVLDTEVSLPPLRCDRERVLQVLANLLGNAIKFTPRGGAVVVRTSVHRDGIAFRVTDSGIGIRHAQIGHVFERDWTTSRHHSLGLGLFIAREIVAAHGGRIWVASQPGRGSVFQFTLPRA